MHLFLTKMKTLKILCLLECYLFFFQTTRQLKYHLLNFSFICTICTVGICIVDYLMLCNTFRHICTYSYYIFEKFKIEFARLWTLAFMFFSYPGSEDVIVRLLLVNNTVPVTTVFLVTDLYYCNCLLLEFSPLQCKYSVTNDFIYVKSQV